MTTPTDTAATDALPATAVLDLRFDVERLTADLVALEAADYTWRANRPISSQGLGEEYTYDWRILPLRSPGGDPRRTDPGGAGLVSFADAPQLGHTPYLAEVIAAIPAPIRSARLMALGPGTVGHVHRDGKCGFRWGRMRLHVPIVSNPEALLIIDGQEHHWEVGLLYYADFDRPHQVRNFGAERRYHLVIDCLVTQRLLELFPEEFRSRVPWREIILARDPVPLQPAERDALRCAFPVPAMFLDWSGDEAPSETDPDVPAAVDVVDDRPVLSVGGRPTFGLVHVGAGDFRLEGWTDERTLHLDPRTGQAGFTIREGGTVRTWSRPVATTGGEKPRT